MQDTGIFSLLALPATISVALVLEKNKTKQLNM